MEGSNLEKCSSSSNIYDQLPREKPFTTIKVPPRNIPTISYIDPHRIDIPLIKRSAVSLTLPSSATTLLSISDDQVFVEEPKKEIRGKTSEVEQKKESCFCWMIYELVQLIFITLFASLLAMLIFTLVFYVSDDYWIEQPWINDSRWWSDNTNESNFTEGNSDADH